METIKKTKQIQTYIKPKVFEQFIYYIFQNLGYKVEYEKKANDNYIYMELTYRNSNKTEKYMCEIKYSSKIDFFPFAFSNGVKQLLHVLKNNEVGLLITNALCPSKYREEALKKNIIILDLSNLLYLINSRADLHQKFYL